MGCLNEIGELSLTIQRAVATTKKVPEGAFFVVGNSPRAVLAGVTIG
jgi:hypothetical protein